MKTSMALILACLSWQALPGAASAAPPAAQTGAPTVQAAGAHRPYEWQQRAQIQKLLKSYEKALNAGDVEGVVQLYSDDGVQLAPQAPSAVGIDAVRAAYVGTFQAISLDIRFEVAELKVVSPEWAFLRTNSTGTIKILANGAQVPEGNQELFLLRKCEGEWKIARYSFSSFLPPAP